MSLLVIVGLPSNTLNVDNFGPARWNFDNSLSVSIVDSELPGTQGLQVASGNVVRSLVSDPNPHLSGVFRVEGNFTSLAWVQSSSSGSSPDKTQVTFALATAHAPEPSTALLLGAGLAARRRCRGGLQ